MTRPARLILALFRDRNIAPSGETVFQIPCRFSVSDEDHFVELILAVKQARVVYLLVNMIVLYIIQLTIGPAHLIHNIVFLSCYIHRVRFWFG